MTSDDEWTTPATTTTGNNNATNASTPRRLFNLKLVNAYGNANIESLLSEVDPAATILLSPKNYVALDWHPRAKALFYSDKLADQVRGWLIDSNFGHI